MALRIGFALSFVPKKRFFGGGWAGYRVIFRVRTLRKNRVRLYPLPSTVLACLYTCKRTSRIQRRIIGLPKIPLATTINSITDSGYPNSRVPRDKPKQALLSVVGNI